MGREIFFFIEKVETNHRSVTRGRLGHWARRQMPVRTTVHEHANPSWFIPQFSTLLADAFKRKHMRGLHMQFFQALPWQQRWTTAGTVPQFLSHPAISFQLNLTLAGTEQTHICKAVLKGRRITQQHKRPNEATTTTSAICCQPGDCN